MYDALLLNSKRIGHGFDIALHPKLVQHVIEKEICLECCPISNFILSYTLDLRTHPVRYLLNQGVNISISSDDPGFYNYSGITLDFVYAFLAWELTIRDLKKLAINGIKYSSISEEEKETHMKKFEEDWPKFIAKFLSKD